MFPDTIHFTGLNAPVRAESSAKDLEVIGEIPSDVRGAFYRAVPDPAYPPLFPDDVAISADGMVSRFLIHDGRVDHDIRYVQTERLKAERAAGRALFGRYRNPYTDDPQVAGVDRTSANTSALWHAGRLFMLKEDGLAYEVNPHSLETIGPWDFYGALRSQTMTAHCRIDPDTGELFFFGYEADGLCSPQVAYCIADRGGKLVSEKWFAQDGCATIHDFAISQNWAIFPLFPTTADIERIKAGGSHWAHQQEGESRIGLMPRYGDPAEMRWFQGPRGVHAYHIMNAFDEGDLVHIDMCLFASNIFEDFRRAGGIEIAQHELSGKLVRWTMDLSKTDGVIEERELGPFGDLPRIRDRDQGRPYRSAWYLSMNPDRTPPLAGGPVGVSFNYLFRIEPGNSRLEGMALSPGMAINEPVHVPAADPLHDGWLLCVVDRKISDNKHESELWVIDAGKVADGPVARVKVPVQLRPQLHGIWVSQDQLASAARTS